MKGRSSTRSARRNRRYFFFLPVLESRPVAGREWWRAAGENNLKAELNFSSSESFVRALGGGQWLNGDVSRKVDSRERPALYRPSIHPVALRPPSGTRTRERAQSYIVAKKYILEKERNGERERKSGLRELLGVAQHPEISTSNYERDFLMTIRALSINSK